MTLLRLLLPLLCLFGLLAGCEPGKSPTQDLNLPPLETRADSVAMHAFEYWGGPAAWASVHYLRFEFAFEPAGGERRPGRKHFWNRWTGDYRLEWAGGEDSTYVVLFNVNTREGTAYLNEAAVDSNMQADMMAQAYEAFINDTYWLLMPTKLLDAGVHRSYEADSSDTAADVIRLTFANVGLTPGDTYWVTVDKATGQVMHWTYVLQGRTDRPPENWDWTGYKRIDTPSGMLHVATRKQGARGALLTDYVEMPATAPEGIFSNPQPRL